MITNSTAYDNPQTALSAAYIDIFTRTLLKRAQSFQVASNMIRGSYNPAETVGGALESPQNQIVATNSTSHDNPQTALSAAYIDNFTRT